MKISIISDLHIDTYRQKAPMSVIDALCTVVNERGSELLLIAGDLSSHYRSTLEALEEIERRTGIPCLMVPGNHDVWNAKEPELGTWEIYRRLLEYPRNLGRAPYQVNREWVVIGDLGWYDFSFGDRAFTEEAFGRMERDGRVWSDREFAPWDRPAPEVHRYFLSKLEAQLEAHRERNIVLVTHVVPHRHFTVPLPNETWRYFNAFLGSEAYAELIARYSDSIRYAVCGHVHYRRRHRYHQTELICACFGYGSEWRTSDMLEEMRLAVVDLDLGPGPAAAGK
ncbi:MULTISPECIES: metallophosphoesterase [Paenibacillus]|uniref:metallophosphoesterase n=1 Tax=Paenibacillus TaxID=44249 RepID=UPI0022B870CB|nr:metallophosphoesterase [Paenibacillus caseinilyticus]MCZ8521999.1 metallophosphoesterase [Paenibacillus caseinilyticus]